MLNTNQGTQKVNGRYNNSHYQVEASLSCANLHMAKYKEHEI